MNFWLLPCSVSVNQKCDTNCLPKSRRLMKYLCLDMIGQCEEHLWFKQALNVLSWWFILFFFPCGVNSDINNKGSWNDTGWCKTQRRGRKQAHWWMIFFFFFFGMFPPPHKLCVFVCVCVWLCAWLCARVFKGPFHLRSTSWYWVLTTVVFSGSDWPVVN